MKIAYIITELNEGGAEHALERIAGELHDQGHEIRVACLYAGQGAVGRRLSARGLEVFDLRIHRPHSGWRLFRLHRWLRRYSPDLVHSWLFHGGIAARLASPRGLSLVHGLRVVQHRRWMVVVERCLRPGRVRAYACVSSAVREFAESELQVSPGICQVIENGIDLDEFRKPRQLVRDYDRLRGLTVARQVHQKGLDLLLEGLARLPSWLDWQWTFAGRESDPGYARRLRVRAEALRISHRLHWLGQVDRGQLPELYGQANLLALPSRWEGQANVVLEAMASGLPVLASPCSGISDLTRHNPACLWLVDPNQPENWAAQLELAWKQRRRLPEQATAAVNLLHSYDWSRVAEAYLEFYRKIIRVQ